MNIEELFSELSTLLKSTPDYQLRNAISYLLDSQSESIQQLSATVYSCILNTYYSSLLNNRNQVLEHDCFIEMSAVKLSILTRINTKKVREIIKILESSNLIERSNKSLNKQTIIRVPISALRRLNIADLDCQKDIEASLEELAEIRSQSIKTKKNNMRKRQSLDFDKINELSEENIPERLSDISEDYDTLSLIYVVNYYYKRYTNENFKWSQVNFNTMMCSWKDRSDRKGSELGMSYAILKAIKDTEDTRPLAKRIQTNYSPDTIISEYQNRDVINEIIYDDIFNQYPEFKKWLSEHKETIK